MATALVTNTLCTMCYYKRIRYYPKINEYIYKNGVEFGF